MTMPATPPARLVRALQWSMVAAAVVFIGGIVTWIVHLLRNAWSLMDVPSASIGISVIAIPIFFTLLGVVLYVFWGLLRDPAARAATNPVVTDEAARRSDTHPLVMVLLATAASAMMAVSPSPARAGHEEVAVLLPGNPLEGSRLFTDKGCPRCHGVYGVGGSGGPDLGRGTLNRPLLEIAGIMWNHSPGMEYLFQERHTGRPTFKPSEMASLLTFLYYLGSLDPPGDPAAGGRLFRDKGCQGCHSLAARGGTVGPALDKYGSYASPLYLTAALWNHGRAMASEMRERRVPRPTFQSNDIPDLLAFIRDVAAGGQQRIYVAPGNPKRGERLFTVKHCSECHAVRGHGGGVGPDLGVTLRGSLMRIAGAMWNHGPNMWAKMTQRGLEVPTLSTSEMSDLVSYLYYFQFIDPPGDARRGRTVYEEKRCAACHGASAVGAVVAPPLDQQMFAAPVDVVTQMWNHAGKMEGRMVTENVAWPFLKGGETADLVAYILSLGRAPGLPGPTKAVDQPAAEQNTSERSKR